MKYDKKTLKEWIDALNENPSKELSKWEENFVSSVSDQLDRTNYLTEPQIDKLESIYAEKTK